jgi:hypothetical protein
MEDRGGGCAVEERRSSASKMRMSSVRVRALEV